jgi:hypothetical protein
MPVEAREWMTRVEANVWRQRREGSKLVTDDVPPHEVIDQAVHAPLVRAAVHFEAARGSLKPLGESGRHGLVDALRRILARLGAQGVPSGAGVGDRLSEPPMRRGSAREIEIFATSHFASFSTQSVDSRRRSSGSNGQTAVIAERLGEGFNAILSGQ